MYKTNEEILKAFKVVMPYINSMTHDDMAVALTDQRNTQDIIRTENLN